MKENSFENKKNNIEKLKPAGLELFNLSVEQEMELFSRVSESKGLVRIFIHPISDWISGEETKNQDRVTKILKRTINSEKSPPIIILENGELIKCWKEIFEKMTLPNDIYLVPTMWNFSYPLVPGKKYLLKRDEEGRLKKNKETDEYIMEGFINFVKSLNKVGVKKMLIGGTNLEIKDGEIYRCVGSFLNILKKITNKEIKLSLGTAPLNRNDLKSSHSNFA
jgi:hypothetical protein